MSKNKPRPSIPRKSPHRITPTHAIRGRHPSSPTRKQPNPANQSTIQTAASYDYEDDFEAPPMLVNYADYEDDFESYEHDSRDMDGPPEPAGPVWTVPARTHPSSRHDKKQLLPRQFPALDVGMDTAEPEYKEDFEKVPQPAPPLVPPPLNGKRDHRTVPESTGAVQAPEKVRTMSIGDAHVAICEPPRPSTSLKKLLLQRAKDLRGFVDLDFASFDLLDLPPMNEYHVYLKSFATMNANPVGIQTNQDGLEQEVQTDDWLVEDKWSQAPCWLDTVQVGPASSPWLSTSSLNGKRVRGTSRRGSQTISGKSDAILHPARLDRFLQKATILMEKLLDESFPEGTSNSVFSETSALECCIGVARFADPNLFHVRRVQELSVFGTDSQILVSAWSLPGKKSPSAWLSDKGVLCLWRVTNPHIPYKILTCESYPTATALLSAKPHIIVAGTQDGGVVLWDLHSASTSDSSATMDTTSVASIVVQGHEISVLEPLFSSYGLHEPDYPHADTIVAIFVVEKDHGVHHGAAGQTLASQTTKIISIDASGHACSWLLIELGEPATAASACLEAGMRIGSRVKLIQSVGGFRIRPSPRFVRDTSFVQVTSAAFIPPRCPDRMLIGTHTGHVLHLTGFGDAASPRQYTRADHMAGDAVTCIAVHPYLSRLFLVGYQSGSMALFRHSGTRSLTSWPSESLSLAGIKSIVWSNHRPSVFFVLEAAGAVSVWDLSESDVCPYFTLGGGSSTDDVIRAIAVNGRHSSKSVLYTVHRDGRVEGHALEEGLSEAGIDESCAFESYVNSL
ncbi:hypothetical protein SeMB42_g05354 [Synchytrium endobioticum]|uniref:Uncharacterized protein n=1 Tax=Synchytrium endobioticum TaxID=286115 RepID=A0A507CS70_9FUNG|nr:hypothetical protein SeMB42_g05354 [Synchytrium endobioticum]